MSLTPLPADSQIADKTGRLTPIWQAFLSQVYYWLRPNGAAGLTASRPVDASQNPLYIGQMFFDTTLGYAIWVKSRNPTVWVNASGTPV